MKKSNRNTRHSENYEQCHLLLYFFRYTKTTTTTRRMAMNTKAMTIFSVFDKSPVAGLLPTRKERTMHHYPSIGIFLGIFFSRMPNFLIGGGLGARVKERNEWEKSFDLDKMQYSLLNENRFTFKILKTQ